MTNPLVSIVITSHNYRRYLADCVISCLGQSIGSPYEILIVDDHSTDGSYEQARGWVAHTADPPIRVYRPDAPGLENASNLGFYEARGRYVMRVDADDLLRPHCLARTVRAVRETGAAFAYGGYNVIDSDGNVLRRVCLPPFDAAEVRARGDFAATGTLYDRSAVLAVGAYDVEKPNCGLENYRLILTLLDARERGICLTGALWDYRIHGANWSVDKRKEIVAYGRQLAAEFRLPGGYQINDNHLLRTARIPLEALLP